MWSWVICDLGWNIHQRVYYKTMVFIGIGFGSMWLHLSFYTREVGPQGPLFFINIIIYTSSVGTVNVGASMQGCQYCTWRYVRLYSWRDLRFLFLIPYYTEFMRHDIYANFFYATCNLCDFFLQTLDFFLQNFDLFSPSLRKYISILSYII